MENRYIILLYSRLRSTREDFDKIVKMLPNKSLSNEILNTFENMPDFDTKNPVFQWILKNYTYKGFLREHWITTKKKYEAASGVRLCGFHPRTYGYNYNPYCPGISCSDCHRKAKERMKKYFDNKEKYLIGE